jgi:hypothetical protein
MLAMHIRKSVIALALGLTVSIGVITYPMYVV